MNQLPTGWITRPLGDLLTELRNGVFVSRPGIEDTGRPILRISSVRPMLLRSDDLRYVPASAVVANESNFFLRKDDLLFTRYSGNSDYVGACARFGQEQQNVLYPDKLIRGRTILGLVDPRYLEAVMNSPQVRAIIRDLVKTTAGQIGISGRDLRSVSVPLPPIAEQKRIAATIEEQFSRLDAAVVALERVRHNLKRIRAAVLLAAVTGRPRPGSRDSEPEQADLPVGWSWCPLEEIIVSLRNGIFVSRPGVEPSGLPILRISAVRPMALNINDVRYVPAGAKLKRAEDYILDPGDLLFTRYSGNPDYVGACAMVPADARRLLHPDKLIRVKVNRAIVEPRFVEMAASAGVTRQTIRGRVKTTAGQTGISGSDLKSVPFPVPPIDFQHRVIEEVDRVLLWLQRIEDSVSSAEHRSSALRSSILATAFSGNLVGQEATDESAAVLLDRISAERAQSNGDRSVRARKPRVPREKVT